MKLTRTLIQRVIEEDGAATNEEIRAALEQRGIKAALGSVQQLTRRMADDRQIADDGVEEDYSVGRPPRRFRLW